MVYLPKQEAKFTGLNVRIRGQPATYELMEEMSPEMNFEKLREYSESERGKGNPYPATAPEVFALMERMSVRTEDISEEDLVRGIDFWKNALRRWPQTASLNVYHSEGQNSAVVHGFGDLAYRVEGTLIGPDGWVGDLSSGEREALKLSFGTKDSKRINRVVNALTHKDAFLWRLNSAPDETFKRVVGFYARSDWLVFDCCGVPAGRFPAFRVRKVE